MFYKYGLPERLDVLTGRQIRFTPAAELNDPFELRPYFDTIMTGRELSEMVGTGPIDITDQLVKIYDETPIVRQVYTLEQFLESVRTAVESPHGQVMIRQLFGWIPELIRAASPHARSRMHDVFRFRVGVLSLSEVPDHPLMWAHYGAQHHGEPPRLFRRLGTLDAQAAGCMA